MSDADTEETETGPSSVRAVDRAISILQAFTPVKPLMSVVEIQRAVGISRPTVYRLLNSLTASGLIESEGEPQRFRLGHGVLRLAQVWQSGANIIDLARPQISQLWERTGETAALFLLRGDQRLCVLEYRSQEVLSISRGVGDTGSIVQGASAKAILAFMPEADREKVLADLVDPKALPALHDYLSEVRRTGYAVSKGEVFLGAVAMAAPVFDRFGQVTGSVGLFGPNVRVTDADVSRYVPMVIEAAAKISERLGHTVAAPAAARP